MEITIIKTLDGQRFKMEIPMECEVLGLKLILFEEVGQLY
jgi:hypothetical protein